MEITVDHISYSVPKKIVDTDNSRLWFIINLEPKSDHDFFEAEELSLYWKNNKVHNCEYVSQIMKKIK